MVDSHEAVHGSRPGAILRIRSVVVISIIVRLGVRFPGMANNNKGKIGAKGSERNNRKCLAEISSKEYNNSTKRYIMSK